MSTERQLLGLYHSQGLDQYAALANTLVRGTPTPRAIPQSGLDQYAALAVRRKYGSILDGMTDMVY